MPHTHWAWKEQAQIPFPSSLPLRYCVPTLGNGHSGHPPDSMDSENPQTGRQWLEQKLGNQRHRDSSVHNSRDTVSPLSQLLNINVYFYLLLGETPRPFQVPPTPKAFCIISSLDSWNPFRTPICHIFLFFF